MAILHTPVSNHQESNLEDTCLFNTFREYFTTFASYINLSQLMQFNIVLISKTQQT